MTIIQQFFTATMDTSVTPNTTAVDDKLDAGRQAVNSHNFMKKAETSDILRVIS